LTICIAAICDFDTDVKNKILLCADRAVSTNIQFEGGEPKIKKITDWCYIMQSSNHSLMTDLILERVRTKTRDKDLTTVLAIVELLKNECIAYKSECIERDVLIKFQAVIGKLSVQPEAFVKIVSEEVNRYQATKFDFVADFIVAGIESNEEAHIYCVNQDGEYYLGDSLGYLTIGSGGDLAFLQMTRYIYSRKVTMAAAITLVYLAKKISERAVGVGNSTDFYILHLMGQPLKPVLYDLGQNAKCMKALDETYNTIGNQEKDVIDKASVQVYNVFFEPQS